MRFVLTGRNFLYLLTVLVMGLNLRAMESPRVLPLDAWKLYLELDIRHFLRLASVSQDFRDTLGDREVLKVFANKLAPFSSQVFDNGDSKRGLWRTLRFFYSYHRANSKLSVGGKMVFDKNEIVISDRVSSANQDYSAAISTEGGITTWGSYNYILGSPGENGYRFEAPNFVEGPIRGEEIISLKVGYWFTTALTIKGQVYAWEQKLPGGKNHPSESPQPILIKGALEDKEVIAIATGDRHALLLTSEGKVYGFGNWGGLGNWNVFARKDHKNTPVRIKGKIDKIEIIAITAASAHSLALSDNGDLYGWGDNTYGALGFRQFNFITARRNTNAVCSIIHRS